MDFVSSFTAEAAAAALGDVSNGRGAWKWMGWALCPSDHLMFSFRHRESTVGARRCRFPPPWIHKLSPWGSPDTSGFPTSRYFCLINFFQAASLHKERSPQAPHGTVFNFKGIKITSCTCEVAGDAHGARCLGLGTSPCPGSQLQHSPMAIGARFSQLPPRWPRSSNN